MTYIYDLMLNFNKINYEFYEWLKDDDYLHIKKINLIKVDCKTYNDFLDNKVKLDQEFGFNLLNKCEYYDKKQVNTLPYAFLISDTYRVMAIMLNNDLVIDKYSSLLLDEESEILELSSKLPFIKLSYTIMERNNYDNLTRKERFVLNFIAKNLDDSFKENNFEKIKYFYYEYFNKKCDNLEKMYHSLKKSLHSFNNKHINLYKLMKLTKCQ